MMMSLLKLSWMKLYWSTKTRIADIAEAFSRNRFHQIRAHLKAVCDHDVPQEQRERDRLWKVRPVLETVLAGCLLVSRPTVVCIDEQMIPFTGQPQAVRPLQAEPRGHQELRTCHARWTGPRLRAIPGQEALRSGITGKAMEPARICGPPAHSNGATWNQHLLRPLLHQH